jgi:hypothetical protein
MNMHEADTMTADRELSRCKKVSPTGDDLAQKRAWHLPCECRRARRRQHRTTFVRNAIAMAQCDAQAQCSASFRIAPALRDRRDISVAVAKRRQWKSEVPTRICDAAWQSLSPDGDSFRSDSATRCRAVFLACCKPLFCRCFRGTGTAVALFIATKPASRHAGFATQKA